MPLFIKTVPFYGSMERGGGEDQSLRLGNTKEIRRVQHPPVTSLRARAYFFRKGPPFDIFGAPCIRCCVCLPPFVAARALWAQYAPGPSAEVSLHGAGEEEN